MVLSFAIVFTSAGEWQRTGSLAGQASLLANAAATGCWLLKGGPQLQQPLTAPSA